MVVFSSTVHMLFWCFGSVISRVWYHIVPSSGIQTHVLRFKIQRGADVMIPSDKGYRNASNVSTALYCSLHARIRCRFQHASSAIRFQSVRVRENSDVSNRNPALSRFLFLLFYDNWFTAKFSVQFHPHILEAEHSSSQFSSFLMNREWNM